MYGEEIKLRKRTSKEWNELREDVKIYELSLPSSESILNYKGKIERWSLTKKKKEKGFHSYGSNRERVYILQVAGVWMNPKGTIKVILAGEGHSSLFSREFKPEGYTCLSLDRYSSEKSDVFDTVQIGTWLICPEKWDEASAELELCFVSNESPEDIKRILETLYQIENLKEKNSHFKWKREHYELKTYGTVGLTEVLQQKVIFEESLRRFKWYHRKARWDLWNAVKANLSLKKGAKFTVKAQALDGNTYELEAPLQVEDETWRDVTLYNLDWWLPFVYRKPDDYFLNSTKEKQTEELVDYFLEIIHKLSQEDLKLGFNAKEVEITRKETSKRATLNYLDGKLVKGDNVVARIKDFFLKDIPIVEEESEPEEGEELKPKRPMLSLEARRLIDEGLNGKMKDLEGSFPFHLNIVFKEDERKWFIECAGKLYYIKGGQTALRKVRTAVKGTAIVDREKYGYGSRKQTGLIKDRIAELVGKKDALEIVLQTKKMGALMKAMKPEE